MMCTHSGRHDGATARKIKGYQGLGAMLAHIVWKSRRVAWGNTSGDSKPRAATKPHRRRFL